MEITKVIWSWIYRLYFHYQLITCLYMFEPWERCVLNISILLTTMLVVYSSYTYLPDYTVSLLSNLSDVTSINFQSWSSLNVQSIRDL